MDKQVLTRRGLFVLGLVAITGRAAASDDHREGSTGRGRHRGYKVGGGMVLVIMAVVAASMAAFGEFRRHGARPPPLPQPPRPASEDWDTLQNSTQGDSPLEGHGSEATGHAGPRQRRARRPCPAGDPKE